MENWISSNRLEFKIILQSALFMIWFVETFDIFHTLVVNYFSFLYLSHIFWIQIQSFLCGKKCCRNMWFESNDNILTIQMQEKWKVKRLLEFHDMPNAMAVLLFLSMRTLDEISFITVIVSSVFSASSSSWLFSTIHFAWTN